MDEKQELETFARAAYSLGWLEGFSAILWDLVGEKLSDEMVSEYEAHVRRVRESMLIEGVEEWKR